MTPGIPRRRQVAVRPDQENRTGTVVTDDVQVGLVAPHRGIDKHAGGDHEHVPPAAQHGVTR